MNNHSALLTAKPNSVRLAHLGGSKVRPKPMPGRRAFREDELEAVREVFSYYEARDVDFGYQGHFEGLYCAAFVRALGTPGFADAVATGTSALYVALSALQLSARSEILVSPITDPGTINAIILTGHVPRLMDSEPNSYNSGPEQFRARITPETRAVMLVHAAGMAAPVDKFLPIAREHGLKVIEDCSQAHGAKIQGRKVGTFGDIAAFSTMYRKAHATGGCGGVVFTRDESLYHLARGYADRGKPFGDPNFNDRQPSQFLFPALNLNLDELSCAIGLRRLTKLDETIRRRVSFLRLLDESLRREQSACRLSPISDENSPFFHPVFIDADQVGCSAREFGEALEAEGIQVNPFYDYVVAQWNYVRPHLADAFPCPNAVACRDASFNLLFNENYGAAEAHDITDAIVKVACHFRKR